MHLISPLVTDPALLQALHSVAGRRLSEMERRAQRISFIFSCLDVSSGISKEQIGQALDAAQGRCAAPDLSATA